MRRFHVLATDYDGTLARDGIVDAATCESLRALRKSGRRCVLVTGRTLIGLRGVFDELDLFDAVVAENGGLLYRPKGEQHTPLAPPPPEPFLRALVARGVFPLEVGDAIVATWTPHEAAVLETIRELGLDLQVIFNKGAVMVLPSGVNKASGLAAWLDSVGMTSRNVVAVGDAENDLAMLAASEASAAVANALPSVRDACDLVLTGDHGAGVCELVGRLLDDDLPDVASIRARRAIPIATAGDERFGLPAFAGGVLVAGKSGGGKTTIVTGILERFAASSYQCAIVDPEGDYDELNAFVTLGDAKRAPLADEVVKILRAGGQLSINLLDVPMEERPAFASALLAAFGETRATTGRPHWIVLDEAHHLLPAENANVAFPAEQWECVLLVTTEPRLVSARALSGIDHIIAVGAEPDVTLAEALGVLGHPPARTLGEPGDGLLWRRAEPAVARNVRFLAPEQLLRRHRRKYAAGDLPEERWFTFTGPARALQLRANNLQTFLRMADGVDPDTWEYHRRRHDYSRWFRTAIRDDELAGAAAAIEDDGQLDGSASRRRITELVEETYTAGFAGRSGS